MLELGRDYVPLILKERKYFILFPIMIHFSLYLITIMIYYFFIFTYKSSHLALGGPRFLDQYDLPLVLIECIFTWVMLVFAILFFMNEGVLLLPSLRFLDLSRLDLSMLSISFSRFLYIFFLLRT